MQGLLQRCLFFIFIVVGVGNFPFKPPLSPPTHIWHFQALGTIGRPKGR